MNRLLIGVMGHVDHGKTALVGALTGIDTDRLPEEKRRGISIALGFAYLDVGGTIVDLIDMPGHERFVRTMVSGATGMTAALLVVAANEGIKPQTLEHLQIARLLSVARVLPVISKSDLVSTEAAAEAARELAALLTGIGMERLSPIIASARTGAGVEDLRTAIASLVRKSSPRSDDGFPYLPIDRSFSLAGHGTIVTGTLRRGVLTADMALQLAPSGLSVRVRGLQVHGEVVERGAPGQRVAVNLRGVEPGEAPPGSALSLPGQLEPSGWLDVLLQTVPDAPPLRSGAELNLLLGAGETAARVRLLDREVLHAGEQALAQLHCAQPIAAPARERFILRRISPAVTVAGGTVLDPVAPRRPRHNPRILSELTALAGASPEELVAGAIERAGKTGVSRRRLARLSGVSAVRVEAEVKRAGGVSAGELILSRDAFDAASQDLLRLLEQQSESQPNGLARRRLQVLASGTASDVLAAVLAKLITAGKVREDRGSVRLAGAASDEQTRVRQGEALLGRVADAFQQGGLTPGDPAELAPTPQARRALDELIRQRVVLKTFDRVQQREILFHRDAIETAKRRLAPMLAAPGLLVKDAGQALGVSRKYSVPLLEYLDATGFTRRVGDRRILGRNNDA